jgi:hypothetical protein
MGLAVRQKPLIRALAEVAFKPRRKYFFYSKRERLLYLSIPKNANSYVKAVMLCNDPAAVDFSPDRETALQYASRTGGFGSLELRDDKPLYDATVRCLVVVRDPLRRVASAYLDKLVKPVIRGIAGQREPVFDFDEHRFCADASHFLNRHIELNSCSFRDFLNFACRVSDYRRDKHYRLQSWYFRLADGLTIDVFNLDGGGELGRFLQSRGFTRIPAGIKEPVAKRTDYSVRDAGCLADTSAYQLGSEVLLPPAESLLDSALLELFVEAYRPDIIWFCGLIGMDTATYLQNWRERISVAGSLFDSVGSS